VSSSARTVSARRIVPIARPLDVAGLLARVDEVVREERAA
jgi:hypothetical protein